MLESTLVDGYLNESVRIKLLPLVKLSHTKATDLSPRDTNWTLVNVSLQNEYLFWQEVWNASKEIPTYVHKVYTKFLISL